MQCLLAAAPVGPNLRCHADVELRLTRAAPSAMKTILLLVATLLASASAGTNAFGKKFLEENKNRDGVVVLPSGLQYKVLREGDGEAHPLPDSSCECHYEGRTAQEWSKEPKGKKFDSSYDRGSPTSFAPSGVVAGWTEAMQLMVEGDKWELYIPSEMGYGDSGQGGDIGPGDVVRYSAPADSNRLRHSAHTHGCARQRCKPPPPPSPPPPPALPPAPPPPAQLVFTMEILKIDGATKEAQRGPPPYSTVVTSAELQALLSPPTPTVSSRWKGASSLVDDGAPPASREPPAQLGGVRWPPQLTSGAPKLETSHFSTTRCSASSDSRCAGSSSTASRARQRVPKKIPSTLPHDSAHLQAPAAPTPPEQLGRAPWLQEPVSGRRKVRGVSYLPLLCSSRRGAGDEQGGHGGADGALGRVQVRCWPLLLHEHRQHCLL